MEKVESKFNEECKEDCVVHKLVTHNTCFFCSACRKSPYIKNKFFGKSDEEIEAIQKEVKEELGSLPVVAVDKNDKVVVKWRHCAEIEEPRRMTNQELAWWLRVKPTREYKRDYCTTVSFEYLYTEENAVCPVNKDILIRKNGGDWHEPLVEAIE